MPLISFGEYRPDVSDYEAATTRNILNVLPRGGGLSCGRDLEGGTIIVRREFCDGPERW